jgi:arylsulfatase A
MTGRHCNRRNFLKTAGLGASALMVSRSGFSGEDYHRPYNMVVIFCDDLGYGDLGVFGHPTIRTPHLDRMAYEGQKWTNFYAAASVCTPSRAAIMTGRYPIRSGMCSDKRRVLFPDSAGGLPASEKTIAECLKEQGYATACIGKWHLGHLPQYLPTSHGFDYYFGIPYSNDMDKVTPEGEKKVNVFQNSNIEYFNVPLMRNEEIIERPADQNSITGRYTDETIKFIKEHKDTPFFVYLAHNLPHVPLFVSDEFRDSSRRGLYGDVIEEIDNGVGRILKTLRDEGLSENTLVVFTSDNGPWLSYNEQGGSAGLLRGGKGGTWEGGMREPTIFWMPGRVKPGVVSGIGSTLDLLPTFCNLSGAKVPDDREMDGYDLSPVLFNGDESPRDHMIYYRGQRIFAVRKGPFKAHFITRSEYGGNDEEQHDPPLLFNLEHDPSEKYNIAQKHPEIIEEIKKLMQKHQATVEPVKDQLAERIQS